MVKTFKADKNGYVRFTEKELKELLDEVYSAGRDEGRMYIWSSPYIYHSTSTPYVTLTNDDLNKSITTSTTSITWSYNNDASNATASVNL